MRILVTGGAGFIGSNFLRDSVLSRPSDEFLNVDSLTYAANLMNLEGISSAKNYRFVKLDIQNADDVRNVFDDFAPDLVVHFAAESHVDRSILGPAAFVGTNVLGTFHLLEAARAIAKSRDLLFHHVSTDEVFGSLGEEGLFSETTAYDPSSPYSASKAASDHFVRAYHRTYGLRTRLSNCSNNYGPYQFPEKLIPLMIKNALAGKPLPIYGKGENIRDWLYVGDHVTGIWRVIEKGRDGRTYNIGGNNEVKNIDLVRSLCALLAEETGRAKDEFESLITYVTDRPGHDQRYAIDATRIANECGWTPSESLETGLRKTVRWYLENQAWVEAVTSGHYQTWIDENYAARRAERGRA